jgi:hypothetical protein
MGRSNAMVAKCPHCDEGTAEGSCIKRNAAGEITCTQYQCRDCGRWWTIPIGESPQLVANDHAVIPLAAIPQFPDVSEQERVVRQIFALFPRWNQAKVGRAVQRSRETVRQILVGKLSAQVAPDIERYDPVVMAALAKRPTVGGVIVPTCDQCRLSVGSGEDLRCSIGLPEAEGDPWFAAQCGAFNR